MPHVCETDDHTVRLADHEAICRIVPTVIVDTCRSLLPPDHQPRIGPTKQATVCEKVCDSQVRWWFPNLGGCQAPRRGARMPLGRRQTFRSGSQYSVSPRTSGAVTSMSMMASFASS